ncbi:MAG: hypothetical protein FWH06_05445 [Oscillospiraceae bacterium]|nr:hypothetical protein [Oscillospiraceae bacterium]
MSMIWLEMKKIWNWKILCALALACALFYVMFMSYFVSYYKSGNHPQVEMIYYAEELVHLYGTSITPEELSAYVAAERERLVAQADTQFKTMPVFAEAGIYSYADFSRLREARGSAFTQAENDAYWTLYGEACNYLGFFLETLEHMEEEFDIKPIYIGWNDSVWGVLNEREQARYTEIVQNNEHHTVLSYWTHGNTNDYAVCFAVMLMLAVLILVSPLQVSDRHGNIHHLQYSSKLGRKIIHRQLAATLLSAFMLTTVLVLIFGGIYSTNGTYLFWDANINSGLNLGHYSVFHMTYGQWVTAMIVLMYILALGVSMLAFVLSRFSRSMITLIMKLIPLFAAAAYLCTAVFNYSFSMLDNTLYNLVRVFGTEVYVCGVVVILALAAVLYVVRREKRVDVM